MKFIGHLQSAPNAESLALLRSLRSAGVPMEALCLPDPSFGASWPSNSKFTQAVVPPTCSDLEYELMATHPMAFGVIQPKSNSRFMAERLSEPSESSQPGRDVLAVEKAKPTKQIF